MVKSYHPISLLSILGKSLESIVNARVTWKLESGGLLSPFQLGFRKGKEAIDGGWRLTHEVIQALQTRQLIQAVSFDIQSAYDTVWHEGLLEKMQRMGIDSYLINWTRSFLSDRQGVLEIGSARHEALIECGVPQGSPLSPTLFLIYINDLLK